MRKLSITLALIVASCTILNAAILEQKNIILEYAHGIQKKEHPRTSL